MRIAQAALALAALLAASALADITYDPDLNRLRVSNYPESWPCTPARLRAADRMNGWGKVSHDPATDTTTVAADLFIGHWDGTPTFFQIGSLDRPKETLLVKGDLVVTPAVVDGRTPNADNRLGHVYNMPQGTNRLTLGLMQPGGNTPVATVKPVVRIESSDKDPHSVYVGLLPETLKAVPRPMVMGGELYVLNGTITAATRDAAHAVRAVRFNGYLTSKLINATFSWIDRPLAELRCKLQGHHITDSVFAHGKVAVFHTDRLLFHRCTFQDFDLVGDMIQRARFVDCVFRGNRQHFKLWCTRDNVKLVDCTVGQAKLPDILRPRDNRVRRTRAYPALTSDRHVILEVTDRAGTPVPGAKVEVVCEQGKEDTVLFGTCLTNARGRTPGRGEERAILLRALHKRATDTADKPLVERYSYGVRVTAAGCAPTLVKGLRPDSPWQVLKVVLERP